MNEKPAKPVVCPACKKKGDWLARKYGPFCSSRCKLIDLGKWLGGEHAISEPLVAEHLEAIEKNGHSSLSEPAD
ncbi:MAG TPA: DNA gyrase inhibitor YacG [Verrucomicrobiae bacterium]|jgi:hypothetical protein